MSRRRTRRSYALELVVSLVAIGAIYAWLTNGGPTAFGEWVAPMFMPGG